MLLRRTVVVDFNAGISIEAFQRRRRDYCRFDWGRKEKMMKFWQLDVYFLCYDVYFFSFINKVIRNQ